MDLWYLLAIWLRLVTNRNLRFKGLKSTASENLESFASANVRYNYYYGAYDFEIKVEQANTEILRNLKQNFDALDSWLNLNLNLRIRSVTLFVDNHISRQCLQKVKVFEFYFWLIFASCFSSFDSLEELTV